MYFLPSWLCLLVPLQTLLVDGNPFHGLWKALMEPLLAKGVPGSPYPPSTPIFPPPISVTRDPDFNADTDVGDSQAYQSNGRIQEDEDTITPVRVPALEPPASAPVIPSHGVMRTRTTPNSSYRGNWNAPSGSSHAAPKHSNGI
jgi:hypothetical protein